MDALLAKAHIIKDIAETGKSGPSSDHLETLVSFSAETFIPAYYPALIISLTSTMGPKACLEPYGLQLVDDAHNRFFYANLPLLRGESSKQHVRRTLLSVQIDNDSGPDVRVIFCDGRGEHIHIADLKRRDNLWDFTPIDAKYLAPSQYSNSCGFFFVGGAPKSGTTWVEKILNAHLNILCCGEGAFLGKDFRTLMGKLLAAYDTRQFMHWSLPSRESQFEGDLVLKARIEAFMEPFRRVWGAGLVGDRSPENSEAVSTLLSCFPNAKFIHCIRHPLDVAVSTIFHEINLFRSDIIEDLLFFPREELVRIKNLVDPDAGFDKSTIFGDEILRPLLNRWMLYNSKVAAESSRNGHRIMVVRYEDLLDAPRVWIKEMFAFLGTTIGEDELDQIESSTTFNRMSGGRDRGKEITTDFFRKGIAGDYLDYFTESQKQRAREILGDCTGTYSYDF